MLNDVCLDRSNLCTEWTQFFVWKNLLHDKLLLSLGRNSKRMTFAFVIKHLFSFQIDNTKKIMPNMICMHFLVGIQTINMLFYIQKCDPSSNILRQNVIKSRSQDITFFKRKFISPIAMKSYTTYYFILLLCVIWNSFDRFGQNMNRNKLNLICIGL